MSLEDLEKNINEKQQRLDWSGRERPFQIFHQTPQLSCLSDDHHMVGHLSIFRDWPGEAIFLTISPLDDVDMGGDEVSRRGIECLLGKETIFIEIYNLKGEKVHTGDISAKDEGVLLQYCAEHFFRIKRSLVKKQREETILWWNKTHSKKWEDMFPPKKEKS